ncbi:MAG: RdgB/HAM1 family non-canonical purine NTP pyrophosphatase [Candidatus Omnitrophica bacterium]|nr:RdgB/HAM1 family non-canonical purine NTP pyrophosphatase [Candidatus Omnitrophota bacterium]
MSPIRTLVVATKNDKKLYELRRYLKTVKANIISLKDFQKTPKIVENKDTFRGNAAKKALIVSRFVKGLAIADDSGLCVKALGDLPGVKSARFAGPAKNDKANNRKVLELLEGESLSRRKARFVCAVAIADNGRILKIIEEDCKGLIAFEVKGRHGFGYDPIFFIPKYGKTFGQLGLKTKDRMSHRSKALKKARAFLKSYK